MIECQAAIPLARHDISEATIDSFEAAALAPLTWLPGQLFD